jgi:predicted lipase
MCEIGHPCEWWSHQIYQVFDQYAYEALLGHANEHKQKAIAGRCCCAALGGGKDRYSALIETRVSYTANMQMYTLACNRSSKSRAASFFNSEMLFETV